MSAQPEAQAAKALEGPARFVAMGVGALAIVVYLCSFSSAIFLYLTQGQQMLMVGGLLVAAGLIRRSLVLPGAIVALVGGLAVLQGSLAASSAASALSGGFGSPSASLPTIVIVVMILALLEAAGAVVVVLMDLGVIKPPAPKPPTAYGPPPGYGQPYQGGYLQQPPPGYGAQQPPNYAQPTGPQASPYAQPPSYGAHGWGAPTPGQQPVTQPPGDSTQTIHTNSSGEQQPPTQQQ
ncbi:DUF5336 domain-containing protein [Pseudonocardia sp.]|uniref:DUF5336 domain-containing protein n=1 Tax=Pseudonocardia sp. TaxID=60912 RepID=UPI003D098446